MAVDIEGTDLNVGDKVWVARKHQYEVRGILIKEKITKIATSGSVYMGSKVCTTPTESILKIN